MKNFTFRDGKVQTLFLAGILLISTSAAFSGTPVNKDSLNKETNDYLSFYEKEDDKTIHWEVNFDDGGIVSIYKNGKKIPDDEISDYKWKINRQLDEMRFGSENLSFEIPVPPGDGFHLNMDQFKKDMERFGEEMKENWRLPDDLGFDKDEFKKQMDELNKKLEEFHPGDFNLPFDSEKFKEKMKELEKHLKEHRFDHKYFHYDCDDENSTEI